MNSSWLLVFKEDIAAQPVQVQKGLFEQLVLLVLDVPGLAALEEGAAKAVVREVFLQALHTSFARMDGEEIAAHLQRIAGEAVQRYASHEAFFDEEERHCPAAPLLRVWPELYAYLHKRKKQRRSLRRLALVWGLVVLLLLGGFVFGPEGRDSEAQPRGAGTVPLPHEAGEGSGAPVRLNSLKVSERESKAYADFTMVTPAYLPDGYFFSEGEVWLQEGRPVGEHALLTYTDPERHLLRLSFYKLHPGGAMTSGTFSPSVSKEVFLRGSRGLVVTTEAGQVQVNWIEHDDTYIMLSGMNVKEEQLLRMAESLK